MRINFDTCTNVGVLAVCGLLGVSVAFQLAERFGADVPGGSQTAQLSYREGETLPAIDGYSFKDAEATLVLAVRSTCKYCTESMPFYTRLNDSLKQTGRATRLVAVSTDSVDVLKEYFDKHGLAPELLRTVSEKDLKIAGTPTLILADANGVVKKIWVGLLNAEREAAVISAVISASKRRTL